MRKMAFQNKVRSSVVFLVACRVHLSRLVFFWGTPMNVRDVHDGHGKLQVFLVLRVGRRARTWNYAIVHARHSVRTSGNVRWRDRGDRLFGLSEKAKTYSPALPANIVLVRPRPARPCMSRQ